MTDLLDDEAELGNFTHNSDTAAAPDFNPTAQGRLRSFVERLERLSEDKAAVMLDMKEVFAEAKGEGYCTKTLRTVLKRRTQDKAKLQEAEAILETYLIALGDI